MDERERRGRMLVSIARASIHAGEAGPSPAWGEDWLQAMAASFVTLRHAGELRGCVGTVDAHRALGDDVTHNAYCAAYRDTRFARLADDLRDRLEVEVSVLSARVALPVQSEAQVVRALRPGEDGVVLECESLRATFLPQVWENLPDPVEFLVELRRKAGLSTRSWDPRIRVSRYSVEKYR